MASLGFIILRCVNSVATDRYWKKSYECVRTFYPKSKIMIIDDYSDYKFVDLKFEKQLQNSIIIKSEFHRRGEFLPYYYYIKNKISDIAVVIHDTVFVNSVLDFSCDTYKMLWSFSNIRKDKTALQIKIISTLKNNKELLKFHNKNRESWKGCFGAMSAVNHDFLLKLNDKYDFSRMISVINNRTGRMAFERVIACIFQYETTHPSKILLGDIHSYCKWGLRYKHYNILKGKPNFPLIKVWAGR